jgi:putative ABC transport system permease protein
MLMNSSLSEALRSVGRDIATSARSLRRAPSVVVAVVLTLTLGLGVNVAVYSFLDQVFFRPPAAVSSPNELRRLWHQTTNGLTKLPQVSNTLSYTPFTSIADALHGDAQVVLYSTRENVDLEVDGQARGANVTYTTANFFSVLGCPLTGRPFTAAEADVQGASRVAVISAPLRRRLATVDSAVLGRKISIEGHQFVVVGVAPPTFVGVDLVPTDVWVPLGTFPTRPVPRVGFWQSSVVVFNVFARLYRGADERMVQSRATEAYRTSPLTDFGRGQTDKILLGPINDARGPGSSSPEIKIAVRLGLISLLVLILAVANIANLLLSRAIDRQREAAVRLALGISTSRLVMLFLMEGVLLALGACAAALTAASLTGGALSRILVLDQRFVEAPLRWQIVALTAVVAVCCGAIVGAVPAMHARRTDLAASLKVGSRGAGRLTTSIPNALVSAQAAMSVLLLVGAALVLASMRNIERLQVGFDVPHLAYATVNPPSSQRSDSGTFRVYAARVQEVADRMKALPSVEAVALAKDEPLTWFGRISFYTASDSSDAPGRPVTTASDVTAGFFRATGMRFVSGAAFADESSTPAGVVINETLARTYWPRGGEIGQCIHLRRLDAPCLAVTGVVRDAIRDRVADPPGPQLYVPLFSARAWLPPILVLRAPPERLEAVMQAAARDLRQAFPQSQVSVVRMVDRLAPQYRPWEIGAALFSLFGALGVVVAAVGIYGSVSCFVTRNTHNLGIRLALGATKGEVVGHVVWKAMRPVFIGSGVGIILAALSFRVLSSLLFGVSGEVPFLIGSASGLLVIVAWFATWIPARRAAAADPVRVMASD